MHLTTRTTDGVEKYDNVISNRGIKDFRHGGADRAYWAGTKIFHLHFGAMRAHVIRTPVWQLECGAPHRAEPSSPSGRGHHVGADSKPLLEDDDRPEVPTTGVQPRAICCHGRGLSWPHQSSSSAGRHGAKHRTLPTTAYTVGNPSIGSSGNTPPDRVACGPELRGSTRDRGTTMLGRGSSCGFPGYCTCLVTKPRDPVQASPDLSTLSSDSANSLREQVCQVHQ
ncbi:hypothetical protein B296_00023977 [Ensete ventricosum]|uniref:Uncharacterized protein n=1 Tax=Ensete ventricosum TaxID=4639 RepID=A0A426YH76_ENSVE|nr:hypothetical protein B296_00023977 [Ensete ventricosum]